jgi:hypothetical protein
MVAAVESDAAMKNRMIFMAKRWMAKIFLKADGLACFATHVFAINSGL